MLLLGIIETWPPSTACCEAPCTPALCVAVQIQTHSMPLVSKAPCDRSIMCHLPKEAPEEEQYDDRGNAGDRAVLLQKQLPVDADCRTLVLG